MQIKFQSNYNMDLLSFLNPLTQDEFYVRHHKEAYDKFHPLLSQQSKENIASLTAMFGRTNITIFFITALSSVPNYATNKVTETLQKKEIILEQCKKSPYDLTDYLDKIEPMADMGISIIEDLEKNGFYEYWLETQKPVLDERCRELENYFSQYDLVSIFEEYKPFPKEGVTIFVSKFQHPHGTKLYFLDDNIIIANVWTNEFSLTTLFHELYHPPYDKNEVTESIKILSEKPWVIEAHKNQNENCRYHELDGFIEENIVEALGVHVAYRLGIEKEPYKFFEEHDYGSHVISPKLFRYLLENPKPKEQAFKEYLHKFVCSL